MNRFPAILLLALLLIPILGHKAFFKLRKWQLRHDFKEKLEHRIPKADLELIKIPVQWLEKAPAHFRQLEKNEFRLDGRMYDIVYQEERRDSIWNYCLEDEAETKLFAQLDDWVLQQSTQDPFQQGQTLQWERLFDSLFQINISEFPIIASRPANADWLPYRFTSLPWELETASPPPRKSDFC